MITITVEDHAFRDYLNRLSSRLADMMPVMESIGARLESQISARFETERDPMGQPWTPWAESTRKGYPKDGNGRILDRYGDMLNSLNWQAEASSVQVGFGQPYAVYHEFGTRRMPRRGLLFQDPDAGTLSESDEQAVIDLLTQWLDAA
jgi:phage virion morphogenesis protein